MASSSLPEHTPINSVDEEVRTYWSAASGDPGEWLMVDLGSENTVEAIQVNFAEHNTTPELVRGRDKDIYEQYYIQTSNDGIHWEMLVDKSQNLNDVPHDYIELDVPISTRYLRITNVYMPGGGNFALRGFRIFGNSEQAIFTKIDDYTVERNSADGRDATVRWTPITDADGYIVNYGIAPDKLYNNYTVFDTDSVVMHSLNHGIEYFFGITAFESGTDPYTPVGEIHSFQSGNWNDVNTWAKFDGTNWVHPSPNVPAVDDGLISILKGHTVTITASDSIDQLHVADSATLIVLQNIELKAKNGVGPDILVEGTLMNGGSVKSDPGAEISFAGDGIYEHVQDGGSIPFATWGANSTCLLKEVISLVPDNANQDFYNLQWNCENQSGDISLGFNRNTIKGNIVIESTGTGILYLSDPSAVSQDTITIKGNIVQSGGDFAATSPLNTNSIAIDHKGNIEISGGNFALGKGSPGTGGEVVWNIRGNVSLMNASLQNDVEGNKFVFANGGGEQTLSITNVTFGAGGFPVEVEPDVTLNLGTQVLEGAGGFDLKPGATLKSAHENGLNGSVACTGNIQISKASNLIFNGTEAQLTGTLLPDTINNLVVDNSSGVTLSGSLVVNGLLELKAGSISTGSHNLVYGPDAALKYSGSVKQTTSGVELPSTGGPKQVIIANPKNVVLHQSRTIEFLDLQAKFETGNNVLTTMSVVGEGSKSYVNTSAGGFLKIPDVGVSQVLFPVGTNNYTPVWISNSGTVDDISVNASPDASFNAKGNYVMVKWNFSEENPGGGNYSIQFGWMSTLESSGFRNDRETRQKSWIYQI
ncbi:MAG: discoidin domain-containing protein [Bacteroidales bacterium]|nr:discoidin domain-containing protein [Bacteroidales bacterium]